MIECKNLFGGYALAKILQDVSLTFSDAQLTVIVGPNGCGKSTLLKLCSKQLPFAKGEVNVDRESLSALSRKQLSQKIALLPQSRPIPDITVGALVLHGRFPWLNYPRIYCLEDKQIAENAMKKMGIFSQRQQLLSHLSGGQRQKVYLAMLLAQDTKNILLDEPTTYLDIVHQLELLEFLKECKREGKTVVVVLHDLRMALENAEQVVVMKGGRVLVAGTAEEVEHSGAIEKAFGVEVLRREQVGFCLRKGFSNR
ncbi:iron-dicitrate ABC transporter ATP-binding protein [Clostridia bacterium]|nr:iron-dicitrate ABC transporter ATP-binding protein [Clostridia bacterium]